MANRYLEGGLPEIPLTFNAAAAKYGKYVAQIMDDLASSSAGQAKGKTAGEFKWLLVYKQAADPETRDSEEFVNYLCRYSEVHLVAKGFKWKGFVKLDEVPPQVLARFTSRAVLICSREEHIEEVEPVDDTSDTDLTDALDKWVGSHPLANQSLVKMARLAIEQMILCTPSKELFEK